VIRGLAFLDAGEAGRAAENYRHVRADRFTYMNKEEERVLAWLLDFHARTGEAPSASVAVDHFDHAGDVDAVVLLEESSAQKFRFGASFEETVEDQVEEQGLARARETFQKALEIMRDGEKDKAGNVVVRGVAAGAAHVYSSLVVPPSKNEGKLPTSMTDAGQVLLDTYREMKDDDEKAFGVGTGYRAIDRWTGGIKKGRLLIHAGFQGHLKSTLIGNQLVNAACLGWNPLLFTSEMMARELMFVLVAIHSKDPKFVQAGKPAVDAFRLAMGRLDDAEEAAFEEAKDDLLTNPDHGEIRIVDWSNFTTFGSIRQRVLQEHVKKPVDVLWIDYLTRLPLDSKYARYSHTEGMNLTITEMKQFSLQFDDGDGLAIGCAHQINREGYKRGLQGAGRLDAVDLHQFNSIEKEADLITFTWFGPEERKANEPLLGWIKNRWGPCPTDPVPLFYDPVSRRIMEAGKHRGPRSDDVAPGFLPTEDVEREVDLE
jgi:replicative DNA helicase